MDPIKSGLKTSEGILTAASLIVSAVISMLVVLNVVEPTDQAMLVELGTKAFTAIATLVVSGIALKTYIQGRTDIKLQQMECSNPITITEEKVQG